MFDEQGHLSPGMILRRLGALGRLLLPGATPARDPDSPAPAGVRSGRPDLLLEDDLLGPLTPAVLVLAHPDDETIGAGSRLPLLGGRATLIYATDGAPRDMRDAAAAGFASRLDYAAARRAELDAALALAGLAPEQAVFLGLADQEASFYLAGLARTLAELFRRLRPALVITHPYEGGHPDHDAVAFAVHAACSLLLNGYSPASIPSSSVSPRSALRARHFFNPQSAIRNPQSFPPVLLEMTSYHAGPQGIEPGEFLPGQGMEAVALELSAEERRRKEAMLACFSTQQQILSYFPACRERFRVAPPYDFTLPPHAGRLFYEQYPWGMEGARWRALASQALEELDLLPAACE